jgi:threonine-phosphate decarboxylase
VKAFEAVHGGDVVRVASELRCTPDDILDFSANINPRGLPSAAQALLGQPADHLLRYPDCKSHPLRRALAERHNLAIENVVLDAGASALILDSFRAIRPARCLCFLPAFAEYRRACDIVGAEFHASSAIATLSEFTSALARVRPDLAVFNNPHNPSGSLIERKTLGEMLQAAADFDCAALVDEAFIDYSPENAITAAAAVLPRVIAVRSLTKFYGCPGLRVGYLVTSAGLARQIEHQIPAWPVGTLALDVLACAVNDKDYERKTLEENARARTQFAVALKALGLSPHPSSANFLFLRLPDTWPPAIELKRDLLINHRILIRDCTSFEGLEPSRFVRLAVLTEEQNRRLLSALESYA